MDEAFCTKVVACCQVAATTELLPASLPAAVGPTSGAQRSALPPSLPSSNFGPISFVTAVGAVVEREEMHMLTLSHSSRQIGPKSQCGARAGKHTVQYA